MYSAYKLPLDYIKSQLSTLNAVFNLVSAISISYGGALLGHVAFGVLFLLSFTVIPILFL